VLKLKIYTLDLKLIIKVLSLQKIVTLKRSSNKDSSDKRSVNELVNASCGVYSGQLVCIRSSNLCSKGWGTLYPANSTLGSLSSWLFETKIIYHYYSTQ